MSEGLIQAICMFLLLFSIFMALRSRWVLNQNKRYLDATRVYFILKASNAKSIEELATPDEIEHTIYKVLWEFNKMVRNIGVWNLDEMVYDRKVYDEVMKYDGWSIVTEDKNDKDNG